jgi:hypothetical protein
MTTPMSMLDALGYLAAGLVLATFCAKSMVLLRMIAIVSNIAFIAMGSRRACGRSSFCTPRCCRSTCSACATPSGFSRLGTIHANGVLWIPWHGLWLDLSAYARRAPTAPPEGGRRRSSAVRETFGILLIKAFPKLRLIPSTAGRPNAQHDPTLPLSNPQSDYRMAAARTPQETNAPRRFQT